jgi:serine protease
MTEDVTSGPGRRTFLKSVGAAGTATALASTATADPGDERTGRPRRDPTENTLLVGVSDGHDFEEVKREVGRVVRRELGATPTRMGLEITHTNETLGYFLYEWRESRSSLAEIQLQRHVSGVEGVKYTESDALYEHCAIAGDGSTPSLSNDADDDLFTEQYAPQQVRAPQAWTATLGSDDVTVAIVDQGVDYEHPDLRDRFGENKGKDFVDSDDDPMPGDPESEYHGTHVAGIASATTGNATGISGLSNSRLLSCRALGRFGGRIPWIADAIQYAADQGADVINMSLGGGGPSETMKNAVKYATSQGSLVVCAAGNDCADSVSYPAAYDQAMAISALDRDERLASFSNYGEVDVAAPGVDVLSTWTTGDTDVPGEYERISGTSMACPVVAGVAALRKAQEPDLDPGTLRDEIKETAVGVGLPASEQGSGRVDAASLLGAGEDGSNTGPESGIAATPTDPHVGETTILRSDGLDTDGYVDSWEWDLGDGTTTGGAKVEHAYESPGEYEVSLTVTDDDGASASATTTVDVQPGSCSSEPTTTETFSGTLDSGEDRATHEYEFQSGEPCRLELERVTDNGAFLYLEQGETLRYECDGSLTLSARDLDDLSLDEPLTVGLYSGGFSPEADYEVSLSEFAFDGDDGGDGRAPSPAFSRTPSSYTPCVGRSIRFDASESTDTDGSIEGYDWAFGDDSGASGEVVTHAYEDHGEFEVTLTVTDDDGQTNTATKTVEINAFPEPTIEASTTEPAPGETVTFEAGGGDPNGSITDYQWAFGDGSEASGQTAEHAYDSPGTYGVRLQVADDDRASTAVYLDVTVTGEDGNEEGGGDDEVELHGGCGERLDRTVIEGSLDGDGDVSTATHELRHEETCAVVTELQGGTDADFDLYATRDGSLPESNSNYDASSTGVGSDERVVVEAEELDAGDEVGFSVRSSSGSGEYALVVVEAGPAESAASSPSPTGSSGVDFTVSPASPTVEETATFEAQPPRNDHVRITAYRWFVDGDRVGRGRSTKHGFESAGDHEVVLETERNHSKTSRNTKTVTVTREDGNGGDDGQDNQSPTADVAIRPVLFRENNSVVSHIRELPTTGSGQQRQIDEQKVTLGQSESLSTVDVGQPVVMDGTGSSDPDGSLERFEWTVEGADGSQESDGHRGIHVWEEAGEYDVSLTVTDDAGATGTDTETVTVGDGQDDDEGDDGGDTDPAQNQPPEPKLSITPASPSVGQTVTFDASESTDPDGSIESYTWRVGGDPVGEGRTHEGGFSSAGTYTVTLVVADDDDNTAKKSRDVEVSEESGDDNEAPVPTIELHPVEGQGENASVADETLEEVAVGQRVMIDGTSSQDPDGSIESHEWEIETKDGALEKSTESVPGIFEEAGERTITLTVTDDDGASATTEMILSVVTPSDSQGGCGAVQETVTFDGEEEVLRASDDRNGYQYIPKSGDPCTIEISLRGPSGTDFDLYVNTDGTQPSPMFHDEKSTANGSAETITLEAPDPDETLGILVHSWSGSGPYELRVREIGK